MLGYIYKITSPSNKIYIGRTTRLQKRMNAYKNNDCVRQPKLYSSLCKYGFDNHKFEIIFEGEVTIENLNILEINFINEFDCIMNGLNCKQGGQGFLPGDMNISKDVGVRERMSVARYKFYENNEHPRVGMTHSYETRLKFKEIRNKQVLDGVPHPCNKVVLDTYTGVYYDSVKELAKLLCVERGTLQNRINKGYKNTFRYIYAY